MHLEAVTDRTSRIIECHNGVHGSMKQALDYALEAGKLLTEQKEELSHGEFLPWLKANMPFAERTAQNYMKVHAYRAKTQGLADLQEVYRQIETIEAQEKQGEKAKQRERVETYLKHGVKPAGWRRGTDDKAAEERRQENVEREERVQRAKQEMQDHQEARIHEQEEKKRKDEFWESFHAAAEEYVKDVEKHEHLNLSSYADNMSQQDMFTAIEKYLNTFDGVSGKLLAAHNLIKKLKMVVNELQRESVECT